MTIKAQIVADSVNPSGDRLTTWLLYYPRCIHAEVMTHRVFSRNSASSRAIPIERMIQNILDDPFIPEWWGKAQPGMQAFEELEDPQRAWAEDEWRDTLTHTVLVARRLANRGLHKQVVNRLLEPWMHIEVVLSGTEFNNFFLLRRDEMAEPHIRHLARLMWEMYYNCADPVRRDAGDCTAGTGMRSSWHLPFVGRHNAYCSGDRACVCPIHLDLIKESVAHAAWVSYGNAAGKEGFTQEDVDRVYDKLVGAQPIHASPTEHVALACNGSHRHGNFIGWCQWRKFLPNESGGDYAV